MNSAFVVQGLLVGAAVPLVGRALAADRAASCWPSARSPCVGFVLTGAVHSSPRHRADGTLWLHYLGATPAILGSNTIAVLVGRQWRALGIPPGVGRSASCWAPRGSRPRWSGWPPSGWCRPASRNGRRLPLPGVAAGHRRPPARHPAAGRAPAAPARAPGHPMTRSARWPGPVLVVAVLVNATCEAIVAAAWDVRPYSYVDDTSTSWARHSSATSRASRSPRRCGS